MAGVTALVQRAVLEASEQMLKATSLFIINKLITKYTYDIKNIAGSKSVIVCPKNIFCSVYL